MSPPESAVKLFDVLRPECVAAGTNATDKESVLREIARLAKQSPALNKVSEDEIFKGLNNREAVGSTGFGDGIAIPHCRLAPVNDFVVGLVTAPDGIEFNSLDDQPVRLLVFIIAPGEQSGIHVRLLSAISQALLIPNAINEILAATSPEAVRESFFRFVRDEINPKDHQGKNLIHIFVQDEGLFRSILQVFTALDAHSITVIEGRHPMEYLTKTPLFSGFWTDEKERFCKVIIAALNKKLTNEAIRRIEHVTGPLGDCRKVLLSVQEMFYTAGALDI